MAERIIAIGDVHGCASELEDLLEKLSPKRSDHVLFLGDLVNRGPESHRTVQIVRRNRFDSLMGNHEHRLLKYRQHRDPSILKSYDYETLQQLTLDDWNFLSEMRAFYETNDSDFVCVHGGFIPGRPWRTQSLSTVCTTKWISPKRIPPPKRMGDHSIHWSELWEGPATVIYGHTPNPELRYAAHTLCIDTACVYGGYLSACILPEMEIVQVKARRAYI
ncbi:MAG: metallophosphoesterase [Verrucomicrobiota bacterium]